MKKAWSVRYHAPVAVCLLAILILLFLPTGFEGALVYQEAERCTACVLSVDDSAIIDTGLVRSGEQRCQLELLDGMFQGQTVSGVNMLNGSLEQDKVFQPGDKALVVVSHDGDTITNVTMSDHYRLGWELVMAIGFAIFLILFAGPTGIRAITLFLTVLIIALVYGFDRRCWAAVSGSFLGILVTCVLGVLFTDLFQIHGAVMSYSESLLYSGYQDLNLTQIFMASIFIGASGAIMDLSVDITSAVYEVVEKRPDLTWWEATRSGMNVGRAAMGTMTTTLLFAYSGGYVALLMVFMAQGTPVENILNYKYVAAELIHTVIGSFGLVTVAPFTALCAGVFLTRKEKQAEEMAPQKECS